MFAWKYIGLDTVIVSEISKAWKGKCHFFSFTVNLEKEHTHTQAHTRTHACTYTHTKKGTIREKEGE